MIILTGGAGFIGTNTLIALNRMGCEDVIVVDNIAATDKWKNLVGKDFRQYIHKDRLWEWLAERPTVPLEAVIHLGACTDTMETDFDYLAGNNLQYSQRLWRLCTEKQVPLVYASSAATYGDGTAGFSDDHSQVHRYRPINPYGLSKHLFDLWALKQDDAPPRWYGLKFFNVYGPYENHKGRMASVAYFAIPQALEKGQIRLFKSGRADVGDGEQKRDFVFVGDVVNIAIHFLNNAAPSGIYNAGSGRAQTFNRLATSIFSALQKPVNIEFFDMPDSLRDSYQYFTEADMNKIVEAGCNFQPTSLEDGIRRYCDWLLKGRPERT